MSVRNHCVGAPVIAAAHLAILVPTALAIFAAAMAFVSSFLLRRREERRELRALARLLDGELATYEAALNALVKSEAGGLRGAAYVAQQAGSGAVWEQTKLDLARHLSFADWDVLCDVYAVIGVAWLDVEVPNASTSEVSAELAAVMAAFNAESVAPRVLKLVERGRAVCKRHLGGTPPVKVSLGEPDSFELPSGD